jgi:hypothetical protein
MAEDEGQVWPGMRTAEEEKAWQEEIDQIDAIYNDDQPFVSIHFVDFVNASLADALTTAKMDGQTRVGEHDIEAVQIGVAWAMMAYRSLHDEFMIRHEVKKAVSQIPDTIEGL